MIAPSLTPGGLIGLCSPSHVARRGVYAPILDALRSRGYRVLEADNLYSDTDGYLATPQERAADFNQLIRHPGVELVFFGGGEGSCELLPYLDFDAIRAHPKRICSYSDGTTILDAVYARTGLEVYYGLAPRLMKDAGPYEWESFERFLTRDSDEHIASGPWQTLTPGRAEGVLFGGYVKNFGTAKPLVEDKDQAGYSSSLYFSGNSFSNMNQMWRLTPTFMYNLGKFTVGLEYELTSVQYGKYYKYKEGEKTVSCVNSSNGLATEDLHWVTNHRVQAMVKFTF